MSRKPYVPRAFAKPATDFMAAHPRCALFAGMGMGKTVITETYLDIIHNVLGESEPTLVLAPLRVARDTWPEETGKWNHLRDLTVVPIIGDVKERRTALRKDAQVYSINYENLPWLMEALDGAWPFANVIADESTKLKGFRLRQGGMRARALASVAHTKVKRWVNLTGTPASNGLQDLWGQTWFLDQGQRLGRTFSAFTDRWFQTVPGGDGYSQIKPMAHAQGEIQERLSDICLTLDPRDWFDIAEPIVNMIEVRLPPVARAKYKEMETEFYTEIGEAKIEAMSAASKSQKLLQLASGAVYTHGGNTEWATTHDEKLAALGSIIEEAGGMPVLCAYHFVSDRARILKAFPNAADLATKEGMARFRAGQAPLGIAHPMSLGHGVDGLQNVTNIIAFFSHNWSLEHHDQIIERIGPVRQMQAGNTRPVFVHYLVAADTIDEVVIARHASKRSVQDVLLEAMKARQ